MFERPIATFVTKSGVEVHALTSAQMREVDRIALQATGPNLYQMMENAGRSLAAVSIESLGIPYRDPFGADYLVALRPVPDRHGPAARSAGDLALPCS